MPRYQRLGPANWVAAGTWDAGPEDNTPSKTVAARQRHGEPVNISLPFHASMSKEGTGHYVTTDFGRTVSGYVELEIAASAPGQCVEISYDDLVDDDGVVNPERSYAHLTDRFILPGGRCRVRPVHPRGFRYVMIDVSGSGTIELEGLAAEEETYPFDLQPAFDAPDPALNTFYRKSAESVRICTTDAFTDCCTRERVQWMEDLYMHCRVSAYAFGDTQMFRRALFQAAQNALPDGRMNGFFPSERTNCAFAGSSVNWLHLLVDYWLYDGSDDIRQLLPTAVRLLDCFEGLTDEDGLIASWPAGQFWDWAPVADAGCLMLTNAAYIWALERLGAHELFREALRPKLAGVESLRVAAHKRFWNAGRQVYVDARPDDGTSPIYSQHANFMAVLAGVCPAPVRVPLLKRIIDPAMLGPIPVGEHSLGKRRNPEPDKLVPVGTLWFGHFLVQALFENGLDDLALEQMRMMWGAHNDLPTVPETRIQADNTFLCHGWGGGPAYLLPAYVLGVQPVARGWSEVKVAPHAGDLIEAKGTLATPRGPLTVSWSKQGGKVKLAVTPPDGMKVETGNDVT